MTPNNFSVLSKWQCPFLSSGTLTSITNLATSLARNMDRLSLDEEHYTRQEEWRRHLPESLGDGLRQGLSRLGISLLGKTSGLNYLWFICLIIQFYWQTMYFECFYALIYVWKQKYIIFNVQKIMTSPLNVATCLKDLRKRHKRVWTGVLLLDLIKQERVV